MTATDPNPSITVVTVAYNSMAVLPNMMANLPKGTPIVIVDNSPRADPALTTLCNRTNAHLIRNNKNRGFGAACNQGAAVADTEFLLFLNPDAEADPGCFPALIQAAKDHPDAAAFNPHLIDGKGKMAFRRRVKLRPSREKFQGPLPTTDQDIPVLWGAAIFLRKDMFDRIQGFDEHIFLYYEDDDLSMRLSEHGPLMHAHSAIVRHLEGHSTERSPSVAYFKAYHLARSRVYAKAKHNRPWPKTDVILRGIRQLISPLMLNKRKRAKYLGYMAGALSTLKDGGKHIET